MLDSNTVTQPPTKLLWHQLWIFTLGSILVVLAYQLADRAIVFLAAAHLLRNYSILIWVTHLSDVLSGLIFLLYPILLVRFYSQKQTYHDRALLALANSTVITLFIKEQLKFVFGRYWPTTWIDNNPSLLRDNVYGFNWFHAGSAYQSFPSGHTAMMSAAMTVLWVAYPRLRWFAALIVILMFFSQVVLYYHFLSDAIAGGLLGYLIARNVCAMSKIKY